jgi:tRNA(fMet)-specific endonuclease VapC
LLLDTNVLIEAERTSIDLDALIADDDEPAVAAIPIAELGVGVEMATGRRRRARSEFLDDLIDNLPIIQYDLGVARAHTDLLVAVRALGRPRGAHDLIIAATALATGRIVVTSDRHGFDDLPGVEVRRPT